MSLDKVLRFSSLASLCFVLCTPSMAGEAHLYVAPYFQISQQSGDGHVAGGTDFDLEDTLGVESDQRLTGVEGFVKFLGQRIQFSYHADETSGSESLSSDLLFNGTTFNLGERIRSDLDIQRYEVMYGFDFGLKVVNVGVLAGVQVLDIDATLRSNSGLNEQESFHLPMPVLGVTLGVHPTSKVAIHAKLSGMSAAVADFDAALYDGFAGVDYYFVSKFGVSIGYRAFILDATDKGSDNRINMDQMGPYIGLTLHL